VTTSSIDQSLTALLEPTEVDARPWWRRRSLVVGATATLVIVLVVALATGAVGSSGTSYRTASVTRRAVDSELTEVATIEPVSQATVGFPTSGTVTTVAVDVGDEVAAGATLAQLDTTTLEANLHTAEQTLAQAQLTLANGLAGEKSSGATGGTSGTSGNSNSTGSARNDAAVTASGAPRVVLTAASSNPQLVAAQQAVLQAQQAVDTGVTAASTAYDDAVSVCTAENADPTACQGALQTALTAQKDLQTAQHQLVDASVAYDGLLAQQADQNQSGGGTTPPSGTTPAGGSTGSTPSGGGADSSGGQSSGGQSSGGSSSRSGGATTQSPSSADLVSYQKAVDAAASQVAVAKQAIAQATITTPIAGQVVAVTLKPGQSVSDATTQNIVVQGSGGLEATTTVSVDDVPKVKVGQLAFVHPDGSSKTLRGSVAVVAVAPASSSSTNYQVTVSLDDPQVKLNNGSTGTVSIVTDQSATGLAVPTSAVTTVGNRHLVTVLDGGDATRVEVTVGVIGREWTSITSGLHAGDEVVLANLDQDLPSSATQSSNSNTGGNFPGGGTFRFNRGN
jgi:HlyD family secretion protein